MKSGKHLAVVKKTRRRLSAGDVATLLSILETWPTTESVTWDALSKRMEEYSGYLWTRQTLEANVDLKRVYRSRREDRQPTRRVKDPVEVIHRRQVDALKAELAQVKHTLAAYEERFILHHYNAHKRGISVPELEAPLAAIDRRRTDI